MMTKERDQLIEYMDDLANARAIEKLEELKTWIQAHKSPTVTEILGHLDFIAGNVRPTRPDSGEGPVLHSGPLSSST